MEPVGLSRSSHAPLPPVQQQQQQHHAAAAQQEAGEFDDDDEDYTGPEAESAAFWHDKYTALLRKVKDLESELRALRRNHAETLEELRKAQRAAASREGSSRRLASVR
jgi:TATA-binding protein-associated factor Taf7